MHRERRRTSLVIRASLVAVVALAAWSAGATARAQHLESPLGIGGVARELESELGGELGGSSSEGKSLDRRALLVAFDSYLEAQHELTRLACAEFAAAGIDDERVWSRAQCARVLAAEREWRRRSDDLVASGFGPIVREADPAAWQRWWTAARMSIWSLRARMSARGEPLRFVPGESTRRVLECMPPTLRADAEAVLARTAEARIEALARIVAEHEEGALAMAAEAERVGIAGQLRETLAGPSVVPPPTPEVVRALDPKSFNADGIRRAVDALHVLLFPIGKELLAMMPAEEQAVRKAALARALFNTVQLSFTEEFRGKAWGSSSAFALELLLTRGIPDDRREEVLGLVGQLVRLEGEFAWRQLELQRADDGSGADEAWMEFDERTKPILVKLRTAIGVERLDRWILANGLVDDAPPERELAALGLSRAAATAELARLRMRLDAGRALERGVGAVAFTDGGEGGQKVESVGADTLTALLIGRELADPGERESMRALLLELLGRLNTRVAEEVRPLERSLTELGEWGARPRDRESALEASRRFSATLERVVPLRDSIEAEFVAEVRAAMGDDAGSVAEAMLAANAARDACLRLSRSYHSATRVEAFGGAPLDLDQLAIVLDDPASRAWLRERLRQHGPALRAQATEFRRHATRLAASVVAVHVTIPVIRFRGGPLAEQLAALRQAFPSVDDYLKVVVEVEPAEAASDGQAGTKPGGDGALTDEHGAVIRRLSTGPAPTIGLSVAVLSSLRAWGDAETRAFSSRDRERKADPGSDEEARIESLIAIEIALQRGGPRAAGLREMRRMLACVESTDAGEDSDDLRLLRKLLRASQSRFERALAEARVVVEEPLGEQATTSDEALDAEYSRRSIAVQGAQHAWRCETDFANAAFEWLAPPAARDRFRNRTE